MNKITKLMIERKSARVFQKDFKINETDFEQIIEAMRMTPTAYGLWNFKVINIKKGKLRDELKPLFYNQINFIDASNYLLFVSDTGKKIKNETIYKSANAIMNSDKIKVEKYINNFKIAFKAKYSFLPIWKKITNFWSTRSVYIAAGIGTVVAADLNIDTCIMEGFNQKKVTKLLIDKKIISKDEFIPLGMAFGKSDKKLSKKYEKKKVRMDKEEFFKEIT